MLSDIKTIVEIVEKLFGLRSNERKRTVALLEQIARELDKLASAWIKIFHQLEITPDSYPSSDLNFEILLQRSNFEALNRFLKEHERNKAFSAVSTETGREFFDTVEGALNAKGKLYCLVHEVVYPGEPMLESVGRNMITKEHKEDMEKRRQDARIILEMERDSHTDPDDPSLTEADRMYIRYQKRMLEKWRKEATEEEIRGLEYFRIMEKLEREVPEREKQEREEQERKTGLRKEALQTLRSYTAKLAALAGDFRSQVALYKAGISR